MHYSSMYYSAMYYYSDMRYYSIYYYSSVYYYSSMYYSPAARKRCCCGVVERSEVRIVNEDYDIAVERRPCVELRVVRLRSGKLSEACHFGGLCEKRFAALGKSCTSRVCHQWDSNSVSRHYTDLSRTPTLCEMELARRAPVGQDWPRGFDSHPCTHTEGAPLPLESDMHLKAKQ